MNTLNKDQNCLFTFKLRDLIILDNSICLYSIHTIQPIIICIDQTKKYFSLKNK